MEMNFLSHKISTHSGLILVFIANDTALSNLGLPPKVPLTPLKQRAITKSLNSGLHSPQNTESRCHPSMRPEVLTLYVSYKCVCPLPQLCLILCDPMAYSPPGSSAHGILQARILEWVAIPFPGDLPNPEIKPVSLMFPALAGGFFATSATWEAI